MKLRNIKNGMTNDDWETPKEVLEYVKKHFFHNKQFFDSCPLNFKFDGLTIEWEQYNYINPPYTRKLKEAFILKAYQEYLKGKMCVMLLPVSTETRIFHKIIVPNAYVIFIKKRIKFIGYNTRGVLVKNIAGQTGSMFVIFGKKYNSNIKMIEIT